jgi:prepilin-type N-terminal cleavage/methylation domain-containing protein
MPYLKLKSIALSAFTLSELLVALAILGLIATFTIPKVLHNIEQNQVKSILKANISAVHAVLFAAWQARTYTTSSTLMETGLNYAHRCPSTNVVGPCADAWWRTDNLLTNQLRLIMPDGAIIWPRLHSSEGRVLIKASKKLEVGNPAQTGLVMQFNWNYTDYQVNTDWPIQKPGTIDVYNLEGNPQLYDSLFR